MNIFSFSSLHECLKINQERIYSEMFIFIFVPKMYIFENIYKKGYLIDHNDIKFPNIYLKFHIKAGKAVFITIKCILFRTSYFDLFW